MITARARAIRWLRALTVRGIALFALAIVASVAFAVIAGAMRRGALDRFDTEVELAVHRLDAPACDVVMETATVIGSDAVLLPVLVAMIALAAHRRRRKIAIVLAIDAAVAI